VACKCVLDVSIYYLASLIVDSYKPSSRLKQAEEWITNLALIYPSALQNRSCRFTDPAKYKKYADHSALKGEALIEHIHNYYSSSDTPIYDYFLDKKSLLSKTNYHISELTIALQDIQSGSSEEKNINNA
jgi:hypothetical protein